MTNRLPLARTILRLHFFRITREELLALDGRFLAVGFVATWLVGMGRYWDSPRAEFLQKLGVGSVLYVIALSAFLWLLLWPLRPKSWSFFTLLTFITLVSPPAALYAIPVERFVSLDAAQAINAWFLAAVATWRVALLFFFLMRVADLRWFEVIVASLLPIGTIVVALFILNLEHVVFDLMSGIRPETRTPNDTAYQVVFALSMLSLIASPVLAVGYIALIVVRHVKRRRAAVSAPVAAAPKPPDEPPTFIPPPSPPPPSQELR